MSQTFAILTTHTRINTRHTTQPQTPASTHTSHKPYATGTGFPNTSYSETIHTFKNITDKHLTTQLITRTTPEFT